MGKHSLKIVLLILSYIIAGILIYMSLTNTGLFKKRLETKFKDISTEVTKNITKILDSIYSIIDKLSNDPTIKLAFFQTEIGGNKREYIVFLSKIRSNISYAYKVILLDKNGNFMISSDYGDNEFKEFEIAKKFLDKEDHVFFGSGDVIYSIKKVYDSTGIFLGYLAIGMYKDLFLKSFPSYVRDIKFIQDTILINSDIESFKNIKDLKRLSNSSLLISNDVQKYKISVLFFKKSNEIDALNITILLISLFFALSVTIWFIVSISTYNRLKYVEEVENTLSGEEAKNYEDYSTLRIDENKKEELRKLAEELTSDTSGEDKYKFEEIDTNLAQFGGNIAERDVASVNEIFEFIIQKLKVSKVMYMKRVEDGFVQNRSVGFNTNDFFITFKDKVWEKFLSAGKTVIVKGNIKELYELGNRISDELFEIVIFPVVDSFGDVRHLFVTGRSWDEPESSIEDKRTIATRIKNILIEN